MAASMTWSELGLLALDDRLRIVLKNRNLSLEIETVDGIPVPLFLMAVGDLAPEDGDLVLRRVTEAALAALKEIK